MKKALVAAGIAGLAMTLVACGGGDAPSETTASTVIIGASPAAWTPVEVTPSMNGATLKMVVGESAVFGGLPVVDDLNQITVQTSDPSVVEPVQPGTQGGVTTGAGFAATGVGAAEVTVINPAAPAAQGGASNVLMTLKVVVSQPPVAPNTTDNGVTITDSTAVGGDPASWAPVLIAPGTRTLTLVKGQSASFADYEYDKAPEGQTYLLVSAAPGIAVPVSQQDSMVPTFRAGQPGTTSVKVVSFTGERPTEETTTLIERVSVTVQ